MPDRLTDFEQLPIEALRQIQAEELNNYIDVKENVGGKLEVISVRYQKGQLNQKQTDKLTDLVNRFRKIEKDELKTRTRETTKEKIIDDIKTLTAAKNMINGLHQEVDNLLAETSK